MNIAGTYYNLNQKAFEIYVSGCDGACEGCHNSDLWDYSIGRPALDSSSNINLGWKVSEDIVEQIHILGGEPLLQDLDELEQFLYILNFFGKPIMLWTRFYEVPDNIKQHLDYIKVGEYQKDSDSYIEPLFGIELASGNQKIIKV